MLLDHTDEVWHLQFSHDGTMLASCGKDQTAILWEVQRGSSGGGGGDASQGSGKTGGGAAAVGRGAPPRVGSTVVKRHVLRGHRGSIAFLCWSPDDRKLATCGALQGSLARERQAGRCLLHASHGEGARAPGGRGSCCCTALTSCHLRQRGPCACRPRALAGAPTLPLPRLHSCAAGQDALRLWDVASGRCLAVFLHHKEPVACAAWFPDGQRLATGGHDKQVRGSRLAGALPGSGSNAVGRGWEACR